MHTQGTKRVPKSFKRAPRRTTGGGDQRWGEGEGEGSPPSAGPRGEYRGGVEAEYIIYVEVGETVTEKLSHAVTCFAGRRIHVSGKMMLENHRCRTCSYCFRMCLIFSFCDPDTACSTPPKNAIVLTSYFGLAVFGPFPGSDERRVSRSSCGAELSFPARCRRAAAPQKT